MSGLAARTDRQSVRNVVVFIADSLRFDDALAEPPRLLSGDVDAGTDTRTSWVHVDDTGEKPPNRILSMDRQLSVDDAEPPFAVVVHDIGATATGSRSVRNWSRSRRSSSARDCPAESPSTG